MLKNIKDLTDRDMNLNQFLIDAYHIFPKKDSMLYLKGGEYFGINWEETFEISRLFCLGLMSLGIEKGEMVGIFSHSRYEWRLCDYGIILAAACSVTLYPSLTPAQVEYIVNDSGLRILFVESTRLLRKVLAIKDKCPKLTQVIVIEPMKPDFEKPQNVLSLDDLIERGQSYYDANVKAIKNKSINKLLKIRKKAAVNIAKSFDQAQIRALAIKLRVQIPLLKDTIQLTLMI